MRSETTVLLDGTNLSRVLVCVLASGKGWGGVVEACPGEALGGDPGLLSLGAVVKGSGMDYTLGLLNDAVAQHAAIRRVRRLQPAGGAGDKLFPPTYPQEGRGLPPTHVFEKRRVDGETVNCVLIDSVQSQANRLEEALLSAARAERFPLPMVAVRFDNEDLGDVGTITSLEAPHRVFDAILRDAQLGGQPFRDTAYGRRLLVARMQSATALFEISPSALVFGAWNSTGEGGGLGAKFPRCLVSEIVGIGAQLGERSGSRIDPLGIRADVPVVVQEDGNWSVAPSGKTTGAASKSVKRPSEINHGNIRPSVVPLGVTVDFALHTVVITLAGLRRLSFPPDGQAAPLDRDRAARSALAALAVTAVTEQDRVGYALRSRCDLVPEPGFDVGFELVRADGSTEPLALDADRAIAVLKEAIEQARKSGLSWQEAAVELTPQPRLVELVRRSRALALAGAAVAEEG